MKLDPTFIGNIDTFDRGQVSGWALDRRRPDRAITIDFYLDGERAATFLADLPRSDLASISPASQERGFKFDLRPYLLDRFAPRLELYYGNSNQRLPSSAAAAQFVNRPAIDLAQLGSVGYSTWIPIPPPELITYITGQTAPPDELRRSYLWSGAVNAADVYDLILDLGVDVERSGFRIVDLGCGTGRYAPFLKQYMPHCEYLGFDVRTEAVDWAHDTITSRHPDVKFAALDAANAYMGSSAYDLPLDDASVHALISMSLFTHLSPAATLKYFSEIRRVLSYDGVALVTFRILYPDTEQQAEADASRAVLPLTKTAETWSYGRDGYLDIYYKEATIRHMAQESDLEVLAIRRGGWYRSGAGGGVNQAAHQDMVILRHRRSGFLSLGPETVQARLTSPANLRPARQSIAEVPPAEVDPVVSAKFKIRRTDRVATAGSCFAQHMSRHFFSYFVTEQKHPLLAGNDLAEYNYGVFTARYGNIYTARQLVQLLRRAYGLFSPAEDMWLTADGRVIDPFRPQIQPSGFASVEEFQADRAVHFAAVRRAVEELDVLVFTLGLTEAWSSRYDGAVYPLCPGVAGGTFDPDKHIFANFTVAEVVADMAGVINFIRGHNPSARFILTVSPVPLIATAEDRSVLVSTVYSKSVLRAIMHLTYRLADR